MYRCVRCLDVDSAERSACVSCNWRATRLDLKAAESTVLDDSPAWRSFRGHLSGQLQPGGSAETAAPANSRLQRLRMLALLVGEDGEATVANAGAALEAGDTGRYQAELLRLAEKLLDRIEQF